MASKKILEEKQKIVKEIVAKLKDSDTVILFSYQGLTVDDLSILRKSLRDADAEIKIYKNTLLKRATDELNIDFDSYLEGPNAILFGNTLLEPIKIIANFAKKNDKLNIRVGLINGKVSDKTIINEYASIPSREGLLAMLASGMMQHVKNLAISLNLYMEQRKGKE